MFFRYPGPWDAVFWCISDPWGATSCVFQVPRALGYVFWCMSGPWGANSGSIPVSRALGYRILVYFRPLGCQLYCDSGIPSQQFSSMCLRHPPCGAAACFQVPGGARSVAAHRTVAAVPRRGRSRLGFGRCSFLFSADFGRGARSQCDPTDRVGPRTSAPPESDDPPHR